VQASRVADLFSASLPALSSKSLRNPVNPVDAGSALFDWSETSIDCARASTMPLAASILPVSETA